MATGTLLYVCWRAKGWDWLMGAGFITIAMGVVLFFVGAGSLLAGATRDVQRGSTPGRRWRPQVAAAGCLLFLNFPAAVFCLYSADDVLTRTTVDVINDSPSVIESFVLEGPGVQQEVGPLAAGQQIRRHLHFRGSGTLSFIAKEQGIEFRGVIDDYVCYDIGGRATIRVTAPKIWRVEHTAERSGKTTEYRRTSTRWKIIGNDGCWSDGTEVTPRNGRPCSTNCTLCGTASWSTESSPTDRRYSTWDAVTA
ncbi:MAG TPA: hypothetical protein VHX68_17820 [Planctomycetaceae bacterium]|nr:hypothetical protein [Planctomycetaceae bacterium]